MKLLRPLLALALLLRLALATPPRSLFAQHPQRNPTAIRIKKALQDEDFDERRLQNLNMFLAKLHSREDNKRILSNIKNALSSLEEASDVIRSKSSEVTDSIERILKFKGRSTIRRSPPKMKV